MWKPQPIEVYSDWVNTLMTEVSEELTDWESTFVLSIAQRLQANQNLTQRQAEVLESIYAKKTH